MSKPKKPRFTPRDRAVLEAIYAYDGMLTDEQIRALFFPTSHAGRNKTVRLFLQRLIDTGYLVAADKRQRAQLQVCSDCMIYWLSAKGAAYIANLAGVPVSGINWRKPGARWGQADHDIVTNDFRIRMALACTHFPEFTLEEWLPARLFAADYDTITYEVMLGNKPLRRSRRMLPDSMAIVVQQGKSPSRFLIEVDMSTNSQARILREKIHAGIAYIISPQYRKRFGDNTGRWLYLMESERRMKNLQQLVAREVGKAAAAFYFTTLDRMNTSNVLCDPIWFHGVEDTPGDLATYIKTGA